MEDGFPIGKGHTTGKCPCGVYHGRRRYPQPTPVPFTFREMIADDAWLNDMTVIVQAMPAPTYNTPKGDDLV